MEHRMDRQTAIRMGGIMAAGAFVGGKYLGDATDAFAMHPKFNTTQKLLTNGVVHVVGPNNWDVGDQRAFIQYSIVQGIYVAWGQTWTRSTDEYWTSNSRGSGLVPGAAIAYGSAIVFNTGGTEQYPWEVNVTLVR
jgi:hypothetical protein